MAKKKRKTSASQMSFFKTELKELLSAVQDNIETQRQDRDVQKNKNKPAVSLKRKFYVASPTMVRDCQEGSGGWAKETLRDAIQHAAKIIESSEQDVVLVVEVVAVVRKQRAPVVVERVV